jgi:hypothetical protein
VCLCIPCDLSSSSLPTKVMYSSSIHRATWSTHLFLIDLITLTTYSKQYSSRSSAFNRFPQSPVTSYLSSPNTFFIPLLSNTKSLCFILHVTDQVSYPIKIIDNINSLNAESNSICHLLALLGAHHTLHVSRIRVKMGLKKKRGAKRIHMTHESARDGRLWTMKS